MLHITNGDAAIPVLRAGGVQGTILPWRDVLHDGPVPAVPWAELRRLRAGFIASRGWGTEEEVRAQFDARDAALFAALEHGEEVRLWFEHDLYDQLQLLQVLAMAAPYIRDGARITLVQADDYLGTMPPDRVRSLATQVRLVSPTDLADAEAAWNAFTAPGLGTLQELAHAEDGTSADGPFPFLRPALQRLLQEAPNPVTGLSRTELQALRVLAAGTRDPAAVYVAAHHDAESPIWLGDASFYAVLDALGSGPRPLVRRTGTAVSITEDGIAVLDGRRSRGELCGYDRWIGGTRLVAAAQ